MPALSTLDRSRYLTKQYALASGFELAERLGRTLTRHRRAQSPPAAVLVEIRRRHEALLRRDMDNVAQGLYARELLFQLPSVDYARRIPDVMRDLPKIVRRIRANDYSSLPAQVDLERFPAYFRRTFHWQTDGYLSRGSARRYDLTVELLFRGMADVMRRQIIPPITHHLRGLGNPRGLRILDVGTGTGPALRQLAMAHPAHRYVGVDLSPYYLAEARKRLDAIDDLSLIAENAEALPFPEGYFDVLTSVYLFHELPSDARRNVLREAFRTLKPSGLLVVEDSAQLSDSADLSRTLGEFAVEFHEPYFKSYIQDDLASAMREVGFEVISEESHLVSKVVAARRPPRAD